MSYKQGDSTLHERGSDGRKPDLGFMEGTGIPAVLMREVFTGVWKVDKLVNVLYRHDVFQVWNPVTRVVAYRGKDRLTAEKICERINGWWEARDFPPPTPQYGPAIAPNLDPNQ